MTTDAILDTLIVCALIVGATVAAGAIGLALWVSICEIARRPVADRRPPESAEVVAHRIAVGDQGRITRSRYRRGGVLR